MSAPTFADHRDERAVEPCGSLTLLDELRSPHPELPSPVGLRYRRSQPDPREGFAPASQATSAVRAKLENLIAQEAGAIRVAKTIELDEHTERELRVLSKGRRVEARLQQRALVVLLAAQGAQNKDIAVEADLDRRQVALWRQRFLDGGIEALRKDAPRTGRPATVTAEVESRIVRAILEDKPVNATHWSTRTLAQHLGVGATTVRRVWQSNGLKPHLCRTFKLSRDPRFEDKLLDVVGL